MNTNTPKIRSIKRIASYLVVGICAFLSEFLSFLLVHSLYSGDHKLLIAQTLSFLMGLVVSFTGSRYVTFKTEKSYQHGVKIQALSYLAVAIVNLVVSNLLIHLLVDDLEVAPIYAKVAVMVSVALWNYTLFNRVVFKPKS